MPRGPQDMRLRWPQDPPQEPVEPTRWNPPSAKCIDGQNDVPAYAKRLSSPLPFTHLSLLHSQLFILPQLDRIECIYVYIYFIYTLERSDACVHACVRVIRGCTVIPETRTRAQRSTPMHTQGNEHVAKIQVHPHRGRSMDGRVHPSRRSHRSNLLGSCWNYVTLRRRGGQGTAKWRQDGSRRSYRLGWLRKG